MVDIDPSVWLLAGGVAGAAVAWWVLRGKTRDAYRLGRAEGDAGRLAAEERAARVPDLESRVRTLGDENTAHLARLAELVARLEDERRSGAEKLALLDQARSQLGDAFKALSAESLRANNQSFMDLAKATLERFHESAKGDLEGRGKAVEALVKPIHESLAQVHAAVGELEKSRIGAYAALSEQVKGLVQGHERLASETSKLSTALRAPAVGGRWGEMQLRRVVELAGMLEHCDFTQQESMNSDEARHRPDLVVRLPGGKRVVVDAKAPLKSYLDALESTDEPTRLSLMRDHAARVRGHLQALGAKAYWERLEAGGGAEFVVLFLPGEIFFSAALQHDPTLIEFGVDQRVILATPTTLIALLRAVAYGWRQERLAENAERIAAHGRNLYNRMRILAEHLGEVGEGLDRTVRVYNQAVGSLEAGVLPAARKFKELGAATVDDIPAVPAVERVPRAVQAEELAPPPPPPVGTQLEIPAKPDPAARRAGGA